MRRCPIYDSFTYSYRQTQDKVHSMSNGSWGEKLEISLQNTRDHVITATTTDMSAVPTRFTRFDFTQRKITELKERILNIVESYRLRKPPSSCVLCRIQRPDQGLRHYNQRMQKREIYFEMTVTQHINHTYQRLNMHFSWNISWLCENILVSGVCHSFQG